MNRKTLIGCACVLGVAVWVLSSPEGGRPPAGLVPGTVSGSWSPPWSCPAPPAGGGSPADPYLGGNFQGNWNLGTAVSSSGDSGYIALGDGDFVSW